MQVPPAVTILQSQVAEDSLEVLLSTGGNLRIKGLTEASEGDAAEVSEEEKDKFQSAWEQQVVKVRSEIKWKIYLVARLKPTRVKTKFQL